MFTKNFTQLNRNDADIAGGKGASLGEMIQSGIPVPEGFVVLAGTFEKFLEETDLNVEVDAILHTVDQNAMHTVEEASEKIQGLIRQAQMPIAIAEEIEKEFVKLNAEFVAVRSSATAEDGAENAWAGQLDSYLNTTEDNLLEKVQHCWASLFTPRAIFYRFEKNLHKQKISVAVVVQKMVASEISGIAFSVHPVTEDYNQLIIEAGFGLGEAIVSGSITPDSYVVEKEPRNILDINVSTQTRGLYRSQNDGNEWKDISEPQASSQVLTQKQILELSEIILGIEKHYGFPCDIEWAYENSKFYIVQSRPITTLTKGGNPVSADDTKPQSNAHDVVPDFVKNIEFFISRPESIQRDEAVSVFLAAYENIPVGMVSIPLEGFNRALYLEKSIDDIYRRVLEKINTPQKLKKHLELYEALTFKYEKAIESFWIIDTKKENLQSAFRYFINLLAELGDYVWAPFAIENILDPSFRERLESEFGDDAWEIIDAVSAPTKLNKHQEMLLKIYEDAIAKKDINLIAEELAQEFNWLGEYSYVEKLYDKKFFLKELGEYDLKNAKKEKAKLENHILENAVNFQKALEKIQDPTTRLQAQIINDYTYLRTDRIDILKQLQVALRNVFARIAENLNQESGEKWSVTEIAHMTNTEILDYLGSVSIPDFQEISKRTKKYVYCHDAQNVKVFTDEDDMQKIIEAVNSSSQQSDEIRGLTTHKGNVTGRVALVFSRDDLYKVTEGSVLVARTTQVDYISAMKKAVAFVTDDGGVTSHAAIVARELKKPCIVGTGNATQVLHDGDFVEVDADNGVVRILEKAQDKSEEDLIAMAKDFDWHHWIDRFYHPFTTTLYFSGVSPEYFTKVGMDGLGYKSILYQFPNIYQSEELTKLNQDLLGEYFSSKTIFDVSKSLEKTHRQNKKKLNILLKNKILSPIEKLLEVQEMIKLYMPFLWIILPMERYYNEKLTTEVPKYVQGDIQKFIGDANIPEKKNEYTKMLDMLNSDVSLEEVQKQFAWMKCRDGFSDLYTIEDLQEIKKNFKSPKKHDVKIPKQLEKLFSEIKELTYFRTDRTDKYLEMLVLVRPILQEVAAHIGVSFKDLVEYEAESVIVGKPKKVSKEFSHLYIDGKNIVRDEPIIEFSLDLNVEIKGTITYKGIARGIAKIVRHSSELDKVKKGDILISQMTFPSFISAMQKASAFVTDEGSITCHAAIIAREMKKPCIIGTRIATQVLHDGDLVEVDANTGIVRIIKKFEDIK